MKKKIFALMLALATGVAMTACTASDEGTYGFEEQGVTISDTINEIDVNWTSGTVDIEYTDADEISFYETSEEELTSDDVLYYSIDGEELEIDFAQAKDTDNMPEKTLTLVIPNDLVLNKLDIQTTTANVNMTLSDKNGVEVETESGNVQLTVPDKGFTLEFNTVSGTFNSEYDGESSYVYDDDLIFVYGDGLNSYEVGTISGNLSILKLS